MKLVYLGTPEIAVPPLRAVDDAGHEVIEVITGVDKKRGRGGSISPSPVKVAALGLGLAVSHDHNSILDAVDDGAELGVVVAYGRIIEPHLLAVLPMVNLHFSLLPRWRGAAPVERAILAGDEVTGVGVMAVEEGLDTGGIYAEQAVQIGLETSARELRTQLLDVGIKLLIESLDRPLHKWIDKPRKQVGEPTYAAKLDKAELEIDWTAPTEHIHRLIRIGGAWTTFRRKRLHIHEARSIKGELLLVTVQPEGKGPMPFEAWRNGVQPTPRELFGWRLGGSSRI